MYTSSIERKTHTYSNYEPFPIPKATDLCATLSFCFSVAMTVSVAAMFVIAGVRPHLWMSKPPDGLTTTQATSIVKLGRNMNILYTMMILCSIICVIIEHKNKIPYKYTSCFDCISQVLFLVVSITCFVATSALVMGINANILCASFIILVSVLSVLLAYYVIMPLYSGRSHKDYSHLKTQYV